MNTTGGAGTVACGGCDRGAAVPDRLLMRYESNTFTSGAIALTYVVNRNADCDSPAAITRCGVRPGMSTDACDLTAWPAWEKMS